ncbi:hypothetical protein EDF56_10441 [Novosphingobium sp. PhB165]|nr:hypothetical protein EDF56_10441 [Novosphingobium sp. PhB165]
MTGASFTPRPGEHLATVASMPIWSRKPETEHSLSCLKLLRPKLSPKESPTPT